MDFIHVITSNIASFSTSPFAYVILIALAFSESSFFPIPPDVLMIPMALANPKNAFIVASITTIASVIGGCFGYVIGRTGGRWILEKFISKEKISVVEYYYQKYDVWAVTIAAFTPIPYKLFTITAGTFKLDFPRFVIASIIGRGGRFFLVATAIYIFGPSVSYFLENYFELAIVLFTVLLIGGFAFIHFLSKRIAKNKKMYEKEAKRFEKDHE